MSFASKTSSARAFECSRRPGRCVAITPARSATSAHERSIASSSRRSANLCRSCRTRVRTRTIDRPRVGLGVEQRRRVRDLRLWKPAFGVPLHHLAEQRGDRDRLQRRSGGDPLGEPPDAVVGAVRRVDHLDPLGDRSWPVREHDPCPVYRRRLDRPFRRRGAEPDEPPDPGGDHRSSSGRSSVSRSTVSPASAPHTDSTRAYGRVRVTRSCVQNTGAIPYWSAAGTALLLVRIEVADRDSDVPDWNAAVPERGRHRHRAARLVPTRRRRDLDRRYVGRVDRCREREPVGSRHSNASVPGSVIARRSGTRPRRYSPVPSRK